MTSMQIEAAANRVTRLLRVGPTGSTDLPANNADCIIDAPLRVVIMEPRGDIPVYQPVSV